MAMVYRCWNPDCRCCRLLPKSRRLPFSGFLPLDVPSLAVGDIFRNGRCRCVCCRGSQRTLQRTLLRTSPTAGDETSRGRNPENGRRRDFGRRRRHRQSGFQHTDRSRPSSPELFNKDHGNIIVLDDNFWEKNLCHSRDSNHRSPVFRTGSLTT